MRKRTAKHNLMMLVVASSLAAVSCDEKPKAGETPASTEVSPSAAGEPTTGKFTVQLKVSGTQAVHQLEGAPKPEVVQQQLVDALYASDAFAKDGPRSVSGTVTYDVQQLPNDGGHDLVLLGGLNSPTANFQAGVNLQSSDDRWKGRSIDVMVTAAIKQFADRIIAQGRVIGGDESTLKKILADSNEPVDSRLMAIQEVRERRLESLLDDVRAFLPAEQPEDLRLAAAATLTSMGDTKSRTEILKIAEDFSRDRNPKLVPLLHILGDLGGTEVVTYLEAVADAHAAPAVRTIAQEALAKARKTPANP